MKWTLLILVAIAALTSSITGLLLVNDPDGSVLNLSTTELENTPFKNFFIPGLVLALVVGGVNFSALIYHMQHHPRFPNASIAGGAVLIGWTVAQVLLVPFFLQYVFLGIGVLIILVAFQLKGKWIA